MQRRRVGTVSAVFRRLQPLAYLLGPAAVGLAAIAAPSVASAAPQWTAPITVAEAPSGNYVNPATALSADGAPITLAGLLTSSGVGVSAVTQRQQGLVTEPLPSLTGGLQAIVGLPFSVAVLPNGGAMAIQTATVQPGPTRMRLSERAPGSSQWSVPAEFTPTPAPSRAEAWGQIITEPSGDVTVIYLADNASGPTGRSTSLSSSPIELLSTTRKAGSSSWSAPTLVTTPAPVVFTVPVAVATPDGRLVTIWNGLDAATQTPAILAAVRSADGTWGATRTVSNSSQAIRVNAIYALRLVTDGAGNVTALWARNPLEGPAEVTSATLRAGASSWSAPELLEGPPQQGATTQDTLALAANERGDLAALWLSATSGPNVVNIATRPAGGAWSTRSLPDPDATNFVADFVQPVIALAPDGAITLAGLHQDPATTAIEMRTMRAPSLNGTFGTPQALEADPAAFPPLGSAVATASTFDGTVTVAWPATRDSDSAPVLRSATLDATGPAQTNVNIPTKTTVKTATAFSLTAADALSGPATTTWSFGDGSTATGTAVEHAYAGTGTYTVTATSVDALGNARTLTRTLTVDWPKPTCTARRKGRALKVTCSLGYNPGARVGISGKIYRVKGNRSYGLRRGTVSATTSTGGFTLSYKIRAARKGRYAVVLTIAGQPTRTVVVSV